MEEGLGFSQRSVLLGSPPFISGASLPSCLPVHSLFLPIYPEKPGGSSPVRWAGFYRSYWGIHTRIVRWVLLPQVPPRGFSREGPR